MSRQERCACRPDTSETSAETERLQLQANILAPHSAHLFRLAGITSGMRVLDVGCGAGDVSMLLAELVGPDGSVIGVDMNPALLELARARTTEARLTNVSYIEVDLTGLRLDERVDALVGRLILIHLKKPAAAIRALSRLVRTGGVVSFQECNLTRVRSVPPTPFATRSLGWALDALRAAGLTPDIGEQTASLLRDAGLSVEGAATTGPAGSAESAMPEYMEGCFRSVLPVVLAHGQVTEAEVDIDTVAERIAHELKEADAMYWGPELAAAWARVP
ncbi:class I SAM-dependent methyltransferase [Streptomyces sp. NPDC059455]|uniref:class I SAM-dependent methyltransferase n=1 Tax=Streptomyces sp. NPDC059455 TaxID=3346837 RepID=UPI0036B8E617